MRAAKKRARQASFPVVEACLVVDTGRQCMSPGCGKQGVFHLAFYGGGVDTYQSLLSKFSMREASELTWERSSRMQREGKEVWSAPLPLCIGHAQGILEMYLGESHAQPCHAFLAKAIITGASIFLFDRNVQRDMHHPSIALGHIETIADFRQMYLAREERP